MRKYIYQMIMGVLCCAAVSAYADGPEGQVPIVGSVYYCNSTTFSSTNTSICQLNNTSGLLPSGTVSFSSATVTALEQNNPGAVGGILSSSGSPAILWSYVNQGSGSHGAPSQVFGLAMTASTLVGTDTPANTIAVTGYYVPCGTSPSNDGALTGAPVGTVLGSNAIPINNNAASCSTGGNVYFTFNAANAENKQGFVVPDLYAGALNITISALTS